jgi:hypothetical protein
MLPIFIPDMIFASRTWLAILVIISLVPLHNPIDWSIFLISMIGFPTFSLSLWPGRPELLKKFKNYGVKISNY